MAFRLTAQDIERRWPLDGLPPEERKVSYWIEQCKQGNEDAARSGLWKLGPRAVPELLAALGNESPEVRACVVKIIGILRPAVLLTHARDAGRRLGLLLADPEKSVPAADAALALLCLGPWAIDALPGIRKALAASRHQDPDEALDGQFIDFLLELLPRIGPRSVPCLEDLLEHRAGNVRRRVLQVLGDFGEDAASSAPRLLEATADSDLAVRASAIWALGRFGQTTEPILAALRAARHDDAIALRFHAALALWKLRREAETGSCAVLLDGIASSNEDAFRDCIWEDLKDEAKSVVVEMGKSLGDCVDGLKLTLTDGTRVAREEAAKLVGRIGPQAAGAVPALKDLVEDSEASVRLAAIEALGAIGPASRPALPAVLGALNDGEADVRRAARETAARIRGAHPSGVRRPGDGKGE